jgi:hypothetical protein
MDFATIMTDLVAAEIGRIVADAKNRPVEEVPDAEYIASETIGEVLDKLLILHIRIWHLEDLVDGADDAELLIIQRKLRHLFRTKRPRLVAALNKMLKIAVLQGRFGLVDDEDVKVYGGADAA